MGKTSLLNVTDDSFVTADGVVDSACNNVAAASMTTAAIRFRICMAFLAFDH
jgi:hypothetical protein